MLLLRAETHDVLDAGPVVPAAVEDHDLAGRRQVRNVALQIQLSLLPVRWRRQCHDAEHARTDPLGNGLDRSAFAGGVAALEHHDHAQALLFDPVLQGTKLNLQLAQ
jgi:hypothetical protein